jgi:membrane protease YdiL (CAAX protease family)
MVGLLAVAVIADVAASASKLNHPIAAGWLSAGWLAAWAVLDGIGYWRFGTSIGQHLAHLRFEMTEDRPRRWLWLRVVLVWLSVATATFPISWVLILLGRRPLHDRWSHCRLVHKEQPL